MERNREPLRELVRTFIFPFANAMLYGDAVFLWYPPLLSKPKTEVGVNYFTSIHFVSIMRIFLLLSLVLIGVGRLSAQPAPLYGNLSGTNEVPAVVSEGVGQIEGIFDPFSRVLAFRIEFSKLSSNTRAAHFHAGATGANGPVVLDLAPEGFPLGVRQGILIKVLTLTPAQALELMTGNLYLNIHTERFPGGEVRAQLGYARTAGNQIQVRANLSGRQEIPANTSTGTGTFEGVYDPFSRGLAYRVNFSGLTEPVSASHFHISVPGANGPVAINLGNQGGVRQGGSGGFVVLTPAQDSALRNGNMYINIHTARFPGGEIRGQLNYDDIGQFRPLPVTGTLEGRQEVPAATTTATGQVTGVLDPGRKLLALKVTFAGLSSNTRASHIHRAAAGTNGPVIIDFVSLGFPVGVTNGTFSTIISLTDAQIADLDNGLLYVNIHTVQFPGGEIRAQLNLRPTQPAAPRTVEAYTAPVVPSKVWPNPGVSSLHVGLDNTDSEALIEVFDAAGQVHRIQRTTDAQTDLDMQALPRGMYFVRVRQADGQAVHRWVKQ